MSTDHQYTDPLTGIRAAIDAGEQIGGAEPRLPLPFGDYKDGDAIPFVVVPKDSQVQSLEHLLVRNNPRRRVATATLFTADSFAQYVNDFKDADTQIFADWQTQRVVAILDYHEKHDPAQETLPRWGQHRATLALRLTEPWTTWVSKHTQRLPQEAFGQFIEDNMADIIEPDGATLFEIVMSLEATKGLQFHQSSRLTDGQTRITFNETVNTSANVAGKSVSVPKDFKLILQPYEGAQLYEVVARIRHRINGQTLSIGYDLLRHARVLEKAFADTIASIEDKTEIAVLRGLAPEWTK